MLQPPEFLTAAQRASWERVVAAHPHLTAGQENLLLAWVLADDQYRTAARTQAQTDDGSATPLLTADKNGNPVPSPYIAIMARATQQMATAAKALGFLPPARAAAASEPEPEAPDDADAGEPGEHVTKRELCLILRISRPTLDAWIDRNPDFPVAERGTNGKEWRFDAAAVVAFLRDKKDAEQREAAERAERLKQFALPGLTAPDDPGADLSKPADLLALAKVRQMQRREAMEAGLLVPTSDVRMALSSAVARLNRFLNSVLTQLARKHGWPDAQLRDAQALFHEAQRQFVKDSGQFAPEDADETPLFAGSDDDATEDAAA